MLDHQGFRRRLLICPAVDCCSDLPLSAQLDGVISLAAKVCVYKPGSFPVHRRNVHTAIRLAGLLLAFFEDVRDDGRCLTSDSVVVQCLSEMHVSLQRLRHLLRDLSQSGARLLILVRSDAITSKLRDFVRSVAVALEVLLLGVGVYLPVEARELGSLAARQARQAAVETAADDARVTRGVLAILNRFEKGFRTMRSNIRRILNHLEIRSWADCDREILFLEEEINLTTSAGGSSEVFLLRGLVGFLLYSRGVVFDAVDCRRGSGPRIEPDMERVLQSLNHECFKCPISLELMKDPVTVSTTGQTYDRASIYQWFKSGNQTCPVTGNNLESTNMVLVPNIALRHLIAQHCHANNIPFPKLAAASRRHKDKSAYLPNGSSRAEAGAMRMLASFLVREMSSNGSEQQLNKAIYEAKLLAKSSPLGAACLTEAGAIPWLLHFLGSWNIPQEDAMSSITYIASHPDGRKVIFKSGGLAFILNVFSYSRSTVARQNAASTLFHLSAEEECRRAIGETPEVISTLVGMLSSGSTTAEQRNAMAAIFALMTFTSNNHRKALDAGVVPNLVAILSSKSDELVGYSVEVLGAIAESLEGAEAVLEFPSAVPSLTEVLRGATSRTRKESCVSVFLSLCKQCGERVVGRLERGAPLMPALYSLLAVDQPRGGSQASSLIRILQNYAEQKTPVGMPRKQQERVVQARAPH